MREYNARYTAYARSHGRTPDEQEQYEPNAMPYVSWVRRHKEAFRIAHPEAFRGGYLINDTAFQAWLDGEAEFNAWLGDEK